MTREPLGARKCAFCGKHKGCFAYVTKVLEEFGGERGNGYAHVGCFHRAKRKALGFVERCEGGPGRTSIKKSHRAEGRNWVD
jgi:hypothetical protein